MFIIVLSDVCLACCGRGREGESRRRCRGAAFPLRLCCCCCWCCATSGFYGFTVSSFASCSDSKSSSRIIRNAPARNNGYGYEWNNEQRATNTRTQIPHLVQMVLSFAHPPSLLPPFPQPGWPFWDPPIGAVAFSPGSGHHHKSITAKWQLPVCQSIHSQAMLHSCTVVQKRANFEVVSFTWISFFNVFACHCNGPCTTVHWVALLSTVSGNCIKCRLKSLPDLRQKVQPAHSGSCLDYG